MASATASRKIDTAFESSSYGIQTQISSDNLPMSPTLNAATPIEDWLLARYANQACDDPWSIRRYSACRLLKKSGISCYLWAEDALAYYGVPTGLKDIHIVVDDVKKAADALVERGWQRPPPHFKPRYTDIEKATCYLVEPQCRSVGPFDPVVALTAASDWDITLPDIATQTSSHPRKTTRWPFMPALHQLLDSFIGKWLDTPDEHSSFCGHISCFVGYLYGYVPILKRRDFADYLKVEHRQYHFDVIAGVSYTREPFRIHSRDIRNSILRGEYELRECSVSRDDQRFFTAAVEARLLAMLPPANYE
ncbi:hypothetical protein FQN50_004084 [Emmonsiellopsis sp. PD_5]|nr:hypothetical protein FQN50_004084 [Emmonsiellopsis sp. PD_5]